MGKLVSAPSGCVASVVAKGRAQSNFSRDVGAGASTLVDDLLMMGVKNITALDLSDESLSAARTRLASRGDSVQWVVADVTTVRLPPASIDIWHDRTALHFLTDAEDVGRYVDVATDAIAPSGYAVIGRLHSMVPPSPTKIAVQRSGMAGAA